jgi:hypothetical protein
MSQNNNNTTQGTQPPAPKVDKGSLQESIKSHEQAVKTNQIVKK